MARESKAAGSPGKCASCGKGLPKGIKAKMTKCPHCGKALNTDSSAIDEALPLSVERAARRLQEALDRRNGASSSVDLAVARAGADVRADHLLEALLEAAVADPYAGVRTLNYIPHPHRAGSFEGLHPRDRLGRFMEKLDTSLRHAVGFAHERKVRRQGRELATLGGKLPVRRVPARRSPVASPLSSPLRSLREADITAALAETEMLMEAAGHVAGDFEGLHPRDRLGKFMDKAGGSPRPSTGFSGTHGGQHISSLYPHLYRVQYKSRIGHREYHTDKVITATDPHHARARAQGSFGSSIRGGITVDHVGTLKPNADSGDNATPRGVTTTSVPAVNRDKPLETRGSRPTYHGDLAPAAPGPGEAPSDLGKPSGADWDTDESYRQFYAENKREGYPVEKLTRTDYQRVMSAFYARQAEMRARKPSAKQAGQGGHDARRHGGSAPPAETRHKGYVIKRNPAGSYDVFDPKGRDVSEKFSFHGVGAAKEAVERHIASTASSSRERAHAQREAERLAGARKRRPRVREAREVQVRLLVEAGTVQDADEAHALLDRMGV